MVLHRNTDVKNGTDNVPLVTRGNVSLRIRDGLDSLFERLNPYFETWATVGCMVLTTRGFHEPASASISNTR